ncbi:Asp-tRNA(Asn)/Glu-tRNA(Gln) amidotransferase subunit GatB [Lutibacter sp. B2]|nr:Asp-tRNA(Asn)/Glu-tRNA(Gln) amidotransferase subunit GatB [Lutibacter sp. B2]
MNYKTLIGLEIHSELLTNSKIFCSCTTSFVGDENTHCCPICLGLPGTLPVVNKKVVDFAIKAGLALNCEISQFSKMDRKNYFYPDLTKAYQISQYDLPICHDGYIKTEADQKIRIRRIHLEEDAGKSIHTNEGSSLLNYNRAGVPLIEIVSEPDMTSADEAYEFLEKLKAILQYIEVSDCKMEQGSLRCDVNINVKSEDGTFVSNIVELKNLNSFKAVAKAIEYEEKRHIHLLEKSENTVKETRRWDDAKNETIRMRSKEYAQDYRYFPEPDLGTIEIDYDWIEKIRETIPELPNDKKKRFIKEYNLPEKDIDVLMITKKMANFFEDVVKEFKDVNMVSNWIRIELYRRLKENNTEIDDIKFSIEDFSKFLELIKKGTINNNAGKKVFKEMYETGKTPEMIVKEKGLIQIEDEEQIRDIVKQVLKENPKSIEDFKNGKDRALGFLIGQVMKLSRGKANPQIVNTLIKEELI